MRNKSFLKIIVGAKLFLVFFTIAAKTASAIPVITHLGSNDPTTEGWVLSNPGSFGAIAGGTETTASGVHDFWRVQDSDTSLGGALGYHYLPSVSNLSGNWNLQSSLRLISGPTVPGTDVGAMAVAVADDLTFWGFNFRPGVVGIMDNTGSTSLLHSTAINFSDFHTFEIQFSQNGAGTADDSADFLIDGNLVFNDVGRSGVLTNNAAVNYVGFGSISSFGVGDVRYESVSFDNGIAAAPVPEPSSILLLGSGLIGLVGCKYRRKKQIT